MSDESYPHIVFVDKGQTENALIEESSVVETQNYDSEGPFYIITILLFGWLMYLIVQWSVQLIQ